MIAVWIALSLAAGTYFGYRYAAASKRLDAIIADTVARLDLTPEDEAEETPTPSPAIPSWARDWDVLPTANHTDDCLWCEKGRK